MKKVWFICLVGLHFFSCKTAKNHLPSDDGKIEIVLLHFNDVYEITPIGSDNLGGLARVATVRKNLLAQNPNTYTILAGDFISPSVIGTLKYDGQRIRGKQMVETLNAVGVDLALFGNHEFDYDLNDLQARINESNFPWLGSNVRFVAPGAAPVPFFKTTGGTKVDCPDTKIVTFTDADGTKVEVGFLGAIIDSGKKPYVQYENPMTTAKKLYAELQSKTDFCLALTHLEIGDDKQFAAIFPQIPLVMGGHDHDNMFHHIGPSIVAKADANVKTVYIHRILFDKKTKKATVSSELKRIDSSISDDPMVAGVVNKWDAIKENALKSSGFDAKAVVRHLTEPLDCRDALTRHQQMPIGQIITAAMLAASKKNAKIALFNSGSMRVDDVLSGDLTQLDMVRLLPFGGGIVEVGMKGSFLTKIFEISEGNKGKGGYFQLGTVHKNAQTGNWEIGDIPIQAETVYPVMITDFLLTGGESNLGFLKTELKPDGKTTTNPEILWMEKPDQNDQNDVRKDIRQAIIKFLQQ